MIIIGIDPGLASVGYGVILHANQQSKVLTHGCITTAAGQPLAQRLSVIHDTLSAIIEEWKPDVAAVEELFFCNNAKTVIAVAQGRGVCLLATARANLPIAEYTPLQIKQAVVGYGKATKPQVEKMVKTLLCLQEIPATNHAADALAVALCHAHSQRFSHLVSEALRKPALRHRR
jgi:crossover junction endodeoxyribonuclease RuvC